MEKDCIFCKIVEGKIPVYKVYENDYFISFLDIRPLTKGNMLVIPKKHFRWTYDVPNFGEYFEVAKKVGLAAKKAFNADWISFLTLGLEVSHAHIRVIPRYNNDKHKAVVDLRKIEKFTKEDMQKIASDIKSCL